MNIPVTRDGKADDQYFTKDGYAFLHIDYTPSNAGLKKMSVYKDYDRTQLIGKVENGTTATCKVTDADYYFYLRDCAVLGKLFVKYDLSYGSEDRGFPNKDAGGIIYPKNYILERSHYIYSDGSSVTGTIIGIEHTLEIPIEWLDFNGLGVDMTGQITINYEERY